MDWNDREDRGELEGLNPFMGHRLRQRERSQNGSWDDFRNHELLEVLLNCVVPRQDMSRPARELTHRYGSVLNALRAPAAELMAVEGITPSMVSWLNLVGELVDTYRRAEPEDRIPIRGLWDVRRFLGPRMDGVDPPECWALYTNFENNLVSCQRLPDGGSWWAPENVRTMVEDCVALQARNLILAVFPGEGPLRMPRVEREHLRSINDTFDVLQVALLDCVLANRRGIHSLRVHGRFDFTRPTGFEGGLHAPSEEERPAPPGGYGP